jgi:hypothetical protein
MIGVPGAFMGPFRSYDGDSATACVLEEMDHCGYAIVLLRIPLYPR